ncbi:hypothetical protein N7456_009243 [Penicillium angulare]|uniref:Amidase domain-containing protein n=1 Tax=Penicillium angulare TaxID=116970 RepID=A0A9W9F4K6_9EURO|nr:hypothetical protein N7456_009243 [Penicillium angulare]
MMPGKKGTSLMSMTLNDVHRGLEGGFFTSTHLVQTYLKRIEEVNHVVRAITELDPTALDQAKALDAERSAGKIRGPLHGIPMVLKNQFATYNMNNTSGSTALLGAKTGRDAAVVKRLRDAGVITLGIANLTQWGNNRNPPMAGNGWSADGGQAMGVFFEKQDLWGSSTGSAIGTALGLAFAGLGTEVEGSIVCVAERSNLVGLKPTVGLVSRDLVILSRRLGSIGPLTRSVKDAAAILTVISGKCPNDPATAAIPFETIPDFTQFCTTDGLWGARIGIPRDALRGNPPCAELTSTVSQAFEAQIEILQSLGATIVQDCSFEGFDEALISKSASLVKGTDFKIDLANYLEQLQENPNNVKTLDDVISWTQVDPREQYPSRGTQNMEAAWNGLDNRECEEFKTALEHMEWLAHEGGVRGALRKDNLDALILPTCVSPIIPALGGYPIITVPMGFYPKDTEIKMCPRGDLIERGPDLPFGLSFIGDLFSEEKIIKYAYAFEQHTQIGKNGKPIFAPESELCWEFP